VKQYVRRFTFYAFFNPNAMIYTFFWVAARVFWNLPTIRNMCRTTHLCCL